MYSAETERRPFVILTPYRGARPHMYRKMSNRRILEPCLSIQLHAPDARVITSRLKFLWYATGPHVEAVPVED